MALTELEQIVKDIERKIGLAEASSTASCENEPIARLVSPLVRKGETRRSGLRTPPVLHRETVIVYARNERMLCDLAAGECGRLDSFRQTEAFPLAKEKLLSLGLKKQAVDGMLVDLFLYRYAVMGIVRWYDHNGASHVLMGIRNGKRNIPMPGTASFPVGLVRPSESLEHALLREMQEEAGIREEHLKRHSGYAMYEFPDGPCITFATMMETGVERSSVECLEVIGGKFVFVGESALCMALGVGTDEEKNARPLIRAFRDQGIEAPDDLRIANDAAVTYYNLRRIFPG